MLWRNPSWIQLRWDLFVDRCRSKQADAFPQMRQLALFRPAGQPWWQAEILFQTALGAVPQAESPLSPSKC